MKRFSIIAVLLVLSAVSLFAQTVYPPVSHYMIGRVDTVVEFDFTILEEAIPFDLEGADVSYNSNYTTSIHGLRIGTYSIISNRRDFTLTVTHTDFKLAGGYSANDTSTFIDYRLYLVLNFDTKYFKSCLTDGSIIIRGSDTELWPDDSSEDAMLLIKEGLFVSLDDGKGTTDASIAALKDGDYSSTISFVLTVD